MREKAVMTRITAQWNTEAPFFVRLVGGYHHPHGLYHHSHHPHGLHHLSHYPQYHPHGQQSNQIHNSKAHLFPGSHFPQHEESLLCDDPWEERGYV